MSAMSVLNQGSLTSIVRTSHEKKEKAYTFGAEAPHAESAAHSGSERQQRQGRINPGGQARLAPYNSVRL